MLLTSNTISRHFSDQVVPLEAFFPLALDEKKVMLIEHPAVAGALNVDNQFFESFEALVSRSLRFSSPSSISVMVFDPFGTLRNCETVSKFWRRSVIELFGVEEGRALLNRLRDAENRLRAFKWGCCRLRLSDDLRSFPDENKATLPSYVNDPTSERQILFEYYATHSVLLWRLANTGRRVVIISGVSFKPFDIQVQIFRNFRCNRTFRSEFKAVNLNTQARKFLRKDYLYLGYLPDFVSLDWQKDASMPNFKSLAGGSLAKDTFFVIPQDIKYNGEKVKLGGCADYYYTWYT